MKLGMRKERKKRKEYAREEIAGEEKRMIDSERERERGREGEGESVCTNPLIR